MFGSSAQPAAEPVSTRRLRRWRSSWKIARRIGRLDERAELREDRRRRGVSFQRTIVVVPSAPGSSVISAVAGEQAAVPDRVATWRVELDDLDRVAHRRCRGSGPSPRACVPTPTGPGVSILDATSCRASTRAGAGRRRRPPTSSSIGASTTASMSSGGGGLVRVRRREPAVEERRRPATARSARATSRRSTTVSASGWAGARRRRPPSRRSRDRRRPAGGRRRRPRRSARSAWKPSAIASRAVALTQ